MKDNNQPVTSSYILRENLITAIYIAIKQQEKLEAGYTTESALLAGLRENLNCLENGQILKII